MEPVIGFELRTESKTVLRTCVSGFIFAFRILYTLVLFFSMYTHRVRSRDPTTRHGVVDNVSYITKPGVVFLSLPTFFFFFWKK